jgi:hypothetical protein
MATVTRMTAGAVARFRCPPDKDQAFLWVDRPPGLGLRVTANGNQAYVFQSEFQGRTLRMTIGAPDSWAIPHAEKRAQELQRALTRAAIRAQ